MLTLVVGIVTFLLGVRVGGNYVRNLYLEEALLNEED